VDFWYPAPEPENVWNIRIFPKRDPKTDKKYAPFK